jgi:hypothetical protein
MFRVAEPKVVMVMFLGGCTMAEVAALRSQFTEQSQREYVYLVHLFLS